MTHSMLINIVVRTETKVFNNRLYWWIVLEYPDGHTEIADSGVEDPPPGGGDPVPMPMKMAA